MRHFGIYANSGDVQTALNEETLVNPYVALVSGILDYDTAEPEAACYLGEWSDDGAGNYTFQITVSPSSTAWTGEMKIGELLGVYSDGNYGDLDVLLTCQPTTNSWDMVFFSEDASEPPTHEFYENNPETWDCYEVVADPDDSVATLKAEWDGTNSFMFSTLSADHPLSMSTINPECSE